jgi:hypothetical protein
MRYTSRTRIPKRQVMELDCAKTGVRPAVDSGAGWFECLQMCASGPDRGKNTPEKIRCS